MSRNNEAMRVLTLLVRHGTDRFPGAVDDVAALFARQLPEVEWDLIVIDNKLPVDHEQALGPQRILVGGSNAMREFSAWQNGLAFAGERLADYDFVNLATEAFRTLYMAYLDRFNTDMLRVVLGRGAAVGHIDYYNQPVLLFGRQSQAWLRTSFVFLPPAELKMLGSLVSVTDPDEIFSGNAEAPFLRDAPLSENYRSYLLGWLTGDGTGQGVEWHSRFTLSQDTLPQFQNKVVSILNEHMFSIRLRTQGCAMVDTTWLATRAGKSAHAGQPLGPIPGWRRQLTERDTAAVPSNLLFDSLS
jgi:hypothetical protein